MLICDFLLVINYVINIAHTFKNDIYVSVINAKKMQQICTFACIFLAVLIWQSFGFSY